MKPTEFSEAIAALGDHNARKFLDLEESLDQRFDDINQRFAALEKMLGRMRRETG